MRVAPALVKIGTPLAETRGAYNAVSIVGDAVGRMFFHGLGAGQMPTASAVVADIIDTVVGRTAITFRTTGLLSADTPAAKVAGVDASERHFLRIVVTDRPGVLARITGILGDHGISIASVIQHDPVDTGDLTTTGVPTDVALVIMTHSCPSSAVHEALLAIDRCDVVRGARALRVPRHSALRARLRLTPRFCPDRSWPGAPRWHAAGARTARM